ncbi:MAG: acyl carrier protein [Oscillibacter sp.]
MDFESVRDVIVETLAVEAQQVTLEATLTEDLGADSLASVELVMALEEASGIAIEDGALAELKTVGDIVNYLDKHRAKQG